MTALNGSFIFRDEVRKLVSVHACQEQHHAPLAAFVAYIKAAESVHRSPRAHFGAQIIIITVRQSGCSMGEKLGFPIQTYETGFLF